MEVLPLQIYDNAQTRQIEQRVTEQQNISLTTLMSRAGAAAWQVLRSQWPQDNQVTVLVGTGNNGGDGFVVAKLAKAAGLSVQVLQVGSPKPDSQSEANTHARAEWAKAGGTIIPFKEQTVSDGILVDALLGTGITGDLKAPYATAIRWLNAAALPILSLDVPSGLDSNKGVAADPTVRADITVTMLVWKIGLLTGDASDYVGDLRLETLESTPKDYDSITPIAQRLVYEQSITELPDWSRTSHKGSHGHLLVVGGGSCGFSGAPLLAGTAALHVGAGLVTAAVSPEALPGIARAPMELMCHPVADQAALSPLCAQATAIVVGPGLGQSAWSEALLSAILQLKQPMVVDADGLNLLAKHPKKSNHWILTPHPKEAARLLDTTVSAIQADRLQAVHAIQKKYGGVVLLKGAGSLLLEEEGQLWVAPQGLPILGTAGTGDVLSGLIGGLLAQGLSLSNAAKTGVSLHCMAAEVNALEGERGMLATELLIPIRQLLDTTQHPCHF